MPRQTISGKTTSGNETLTADCEDTQGTNIEWQIHFTLFERAKRTDPFGDPIVKLDVDVRTSLAASAEAMAQSHPTPEQAAEIVGPVAEDAKAVKKQEITTPEFYESAQSVLA